jgi:hypothetical protein
MVRPEMAEAMMSNAKRAALYLRVSTGEQTTANQRRELLEAATHKGWDVVAEFEDAGISGAKGRDQRPGLDAMLRRAGGATTKNSLLDELCARAILRPLTSRPRYFRAPPSDRDRVVGRDEIMVALDRRRRTGNGGAVDPSRHHQYNCRHFDARFVGPLQIR